MRVGIRVWIAVVGGGLAVSLGVMASLGSGAVVPAARAGTTSLTPVPLDSLVVPELQRLDGGELLLDQELARKADPQAIFARQRSRTAYRHLGAQAAAKLARLAFPAAVTQAESGVPSLPAGDRISGYASANVAQVALPGDKHAVLDSTTPLAVKTGHGRFTPINLALTHTPGGYAPANSPVAVEIPKHLSAGVQVLGGAISLTPIDARGAALSGTEGSLDGASVLYANTQTDTDTLAAPTTGGVRVDAMLRAADSPQRLRYRVGLPPRARLVADRRTGAVLLKQGQSVIAAVLPPSAEDSAKRPVPVSMHTSGKTLSLTVDHRAGSYDYPIALDPELKTLEDRRVGEVYAGVTAPTNWKFVSTPPGQFKVTGTEALTISPNGGGYLAGQSTALIYETQGDSKIYEVLAESSGTDAGSNTETVLWLPTAFSYWHKVNENYTPVWGSDCEANPAHECVGPNVANQKNHAEFRTVAYANGTSFSNTLIKAHVLIAQEGVPTIGFNKTSGTLPGGWTNAFYGSGAWLGPQSGGYEIEAADPGLGISHFEVKTTTNVWQLKHEFLEEKKCSGVQCPPSLKEVSINKEGEILTYNSSLPDGEDPIEAAIENPLNIWSPLLKGTLKVDGTKPYGIKLTSGLAETGAEINATPHPISVEVTDGTKPTISSGIKSIQLLLDGNEVGTPSAGCSPGECKSTGTWTIHGESIGAGEHTLTVRATDNAGNVTDKPYTFAVRNATPVALGPGELDPVTGQLALTATDTAITGVGGLSRTYLSRSPSGNLESPLGPQWGLSLGSGQSLRLLPNGGAELAGPNGGLTTFASDQAGGFVPPPGDNNIKLEAKEKEAGKGITEYLLKQPTAGTTTVFTQPVNAQFATPTYFSQFGVIGTGSGGQFQDPVAVLAASKGIVWVVDRQNNRVQKFSETGKYLSQFGTYGSGNGQFASPSAIATDAKGDLWVDDLGNSRLEEFNEAGEYLKTIGTEGDGAAAKPVTGFTIDSKGNIWVVEGKHSVLREYNEEGTFLHEIKSSLLNEPIDVATDSNGNVWVTDDYYDRVQEYDHEGNPLTQFGSSGTENGHLISPGGISIDSKNNVWVVDEGNSRVQEFGEKGEYLAKFGVKGSNSGQFGAPMGIAVNSKGSIWVTDRQNGRVEEWTHPIWLPTSTEGSAPDAAYTSSYRTVMIEGNNITEPTEVLGPEPPGVSCSTSLERGCRALLFAYAVKTTATGEGSSEWGEYNGRLMGVSFTAYNPTSKAMQTTTVAQYAYDKQGRLRAEWDPRISLALKTTYGYDAEGHVTAVSSPGQQPWLFNYGTATGDTGKRIVSMTRPAASTASGNGLTPVNTVAPVLSTTHPRAGVPMSISNGSWSNTPLSYSYQWVTCSGEVCTPILGATSQSYTPGEESAAGYRATVTATNANGSVTVTSSNLAAKALPNVKFVLENIFGAEGTAPGQVKKTVGCRCRIREHIGRKRMGRRLRQQSH